MSASKYWKKLSIINITIGLDSENDITVSIESNKRARENKGKSVLDTPSDYTVVDTETTGLSPTYDEIIELSALRVRNNIIVDEFTSLVKPRCEIDEFITELTGITNGMVVDAPTIEEVLPLFLDFIGDDILVGHKINFDINFIYDNSEYCLNRLFTNNFVDTYRLSLRIFPNAAHHRLKDVCELYQIPYENAHRSLNDCKMTQQVYIKLVDDIKNSEIPLHKMSCKKNDNQLPKMSYKKTTDISELEDRIGKINNQAQFSGKICVFTGTLEKLTRSEAEYIVTYCGGTCGKSVTKKTNYLILGNNDYCKSIKDGKSNKQKTAEQYKIQGCDIEIIPESVFYDLVSEQND